MKKNQIVLILISFFCQLTFSQGVRKISGTMYSGGASGIGGIFTADTSGNNFKLDAYSFNITNPGGFPLNTRLVELGGKFYGVTSTGEGIYNGGVLFEWDPLSNIYTVKYVFSDATKAISPVGSLTLYNGKFYGTASCGSFTTLLAIFEWDPVTNIFTVRKQLDSQLSGVNSRGTMVEHNGKMYGTTEQGGLNDYGVIFEWDPTTNVYTNKFDFSLTTGINPTSNLCFLNGKFYGATRTGADPYSLGTLFEWDPETNVFGIKHVFEESTGSSPSGTMVSFNNKLIGMTPAGGDKNTGVIFEYSPASNIYTKKYSFDSTSAMFPYGSLVLNGSKFYGLSSEGGDQGLGVLFEWDPSIDSFSRKADFTNTNGAYPYNDVTFYNGKAYGLASSGGRQNLGVIFEWDTSTNIINNKIDLGVTNLLWPIGAMVVNDAQIFGLAERNANSEPLIYEWKSQLQADSVIIKFDSTNDLSNTRPAGRMVKGPNNNYYGLTTLGGSAQYGTLFEWNPVTKVLSKKIEFDPTRGLSPNGSLTLLDNKFYGMTSFGGTKNVGVIFEYDPISNIYTKKFDFDIVNGCNPYGNLTFYNGKFYGLIAGGGRDSVGLIFEWNPYTNQITRKFEFDRTNGSTPYGSVTEYGGKLYGLTSLGGVNNKGVLFEFDLSTSVYTKLHDFNGSDGELPSGNLILSGSNLYGTTNSGGSVDQGVFFEWSITTGIFTIKGQLNHISPASSSLFAMDNLSLLPATPSNGLLNASVPLSPIVINSSNNNKWVSIVDQFGDAVGEINARGNNLGNVSAQLYVHGGNTREDFNKRLYLNRNITITPQFQPVSPVDIRLYIKESEYQAIRTAVNSSGQASGITSINDLTIFKNNDPNGSVIASAALPITSTATGWEGTGYVFTATINSFSSFYFASTANAALPLKILAFTATRRNNETLLNWETTNEQGTDSFMIERSLDGSSFQTVGAVKARNVSGFNNYRFIDGTPVSSNTSKAYYRLKQTDIDKNYSYSKLILLDWGTSKTIVKISPNPVSENATISLQLRNAERINIRVVNTNGQTVIQKTLNLTPGINNVPLDTRSLPAGTYILLLNRKDAMEQSMFIKE